MNKYRIDAVAGLVYGAQGPLRKISSGGYIQTVVRRGHAPFVHRIIWESVHGPIPEGLYINHINGIKTDNRIANLELVTTSENHKHAYRIGLRRADGPYNGRSIGKRRREAQEKAA